MMQHLIKVKSNFFLSTVCFFLLGFLPSSAEAQTVIGGLTPDPAAMLDIQSTSKGVLFPRVPNNSSVTSPATGLIIWNDATGCLEINLGTPGSPNWQSIKCEVQCGAYVAPGVWKRFMCHNLGAANFSADPFTPSWEINGNYYQWGYKPTCFGKDDIDAANPCIGAVFGASGPWGSTGSEDNEGSISGWNTTLAADGAWSDMEKKDADPCPEGYRVPTQSQWDGVADPTLNPVSDASGSTWTPSTTNYDSGMNFGPSLMLPITGFRDNNDGTLIDRGIFGLYWSSTERGTNNAWALGIESDGAVTNDDIRTSGYSVRCVAE